MAPQLPETTRQSRRTRPDDHGTMRANERSRVGQSIFDPGLSTAEHISNVSGRGVAMDVVKTNIEKIGGTEGVSSVPGEGTTVRMKIPLRIPIIPALIVTSGDNRWAKKSHVRLC